MGARGGATHMALRLASSHESRSVFAKGCGVRQGAGAVTYAACACLCSAVSASGDTRGLTCGSTPGRRIQFFRGAALPRTEEAEG